MKVKALILVIAAAISGCTSQQEKMHVEGRVDATRVMYTCTTLAQKQLAIQQFQACYLTSPKTKQNRQECEETARALACDRLLDDTN